MRPSWLQKLIEKQAKRDYKGHPALMCVIKPDVRTFEWIDPHKPRRFSFRKDGKHQTEDKS